MQSALAHFDAVPLAGLMLVVTLGFFLGRLSYRGLSMGPAGGTLIVAIALGHSGLSFAGLYGTPAPRITLGDLGFALFIYSVGFDAGPRIFDSFRGGRGWQFPLVGALVSVLALVIAVICGRVLGLGESVTAGLLAGALTSTPTYAAAAEICDDPAALAVAFAFTFPVGLVGLVLLVGILPRFLHEDLGAGLDETDDDADTISAELRRVFEVRRDEVVGRSLAELALPRTTGCTVTRLHRGRRVLVPDGAVRLERGDHLMAKGRLEALRIFERRVGPEVYDEDLRRRLPSPRAVLVTSNAAVGRTLRELEIFRQHHTLATEVVRQGMAIEPTADLELCRDDIVRVVGERDSVRAIARHLGRFERSTQETDIAVYAGGILLGLLVGEVHIPGMGFELRVGNAVGLLLVGVLLGRFRRVGRFSAHVPIAARQLVRDLGILLFVAETGVRAGGDAFTGLGSWLTPLLACAALVTILPVLVAVFVGRQLLGLRPVQTWGSIAGGMTSSSALAAIRNAADSNEPAISYAAAYAVASVLATLAGQLVVLLV